MGILSKIANAAGSFIGDTSQNKQPLWKKLLSIGGAAAGAAGGPAGRIINAATTAVTGPTPPMRSDLVEPKDSGALVQPVEPPINANPLSQADFRQQQQGYDAGFFEGTRTPPPLPGGGNQGPTTPGVSGGSVEGPGGATTQTEEKEKKKRKFSMPQLSMPQRNQAQLPQEAIPVIPVDQGPVANPQSTGGFRPASAISPMPVEQGLEKKNIDTTAPQLLNAVGPENVAQPIDVTGATPTQADFRQQQAADQQAQYNANVAADYETQRPVELAAVSPQGINQPIDVTGATPTQADFRQGQEQQQQADFTAEQARKQEEATAAGNRYSEEMVGGLLRTGQAPILTGGTTMDPNTAAIVNKPYSPNAPYAVSPEGTVLRQTSNGYVIDNTINASEAGRRNDEAAQQLLEPPKPNMTNAFPYKGQKVVIDREKKAIVDENGNVVATLAEAYKDPIFRRDSTIKEAESDLNTALAKGDRIGIAEAQNRIAAANYEYERNPAKDTKRSFKDFLKGAALGGLKGLAEGKGNLWAALGGAATGGAGSLIVPDFEQKLAQQMYRLPKAAREYDASQKALNALYGQEKAEQLRITRDIVNQDKVLRSNLARLNGDDVYKRKLRSGDAWTQEEIDALDNRVGFRTGVQPGIRFGGRYMYIPSKGGALYHIYNDGASEPVILNDGEVARDPSKAATQITYKIDGQEVTYDVTEGQAAAATARIAESIKRSTEQSRREAMRQKGVSEKNIAKREASIAKLKRNRTKIEGQEAYDNKKVEDYNKKIAEIDEKIKANHTLNGVYNADRAVDVELEKTLQAEKQKYQNWIAAAEKRLSNYGLDKTKIDSEITFLLGDDNGANPVDEEKDNTDNTEDGTEEQ